MMKLLWTILHVDLYEHLLEGIMQVKGVRSQRPDDTALILAHTVGHDTLQIWGKDIGLDAYTN